jgi:hypothetical protein
MSKLKGSVTMTTREENTPMRFQLSGSNYKITVVVNFENEKLGDWEICLKIN